MSTLRINNIEAQSVPASPTIDEKVKVTNSSGDILVNIDGKTSGITTIGINTTDGNIKFDANSNVLITGILTATTLAGNFTPDSLEIGSNIKLGNAGVITATSFVGSGANLTGITQTTINNNADNRVITGSGTANTLEADANLTWNNSTGQLVVGASGSGYISVRKPAIAQVDIQHSTTNSYSRLYMSQSSGSGGYFAINKLGTVDAGYTGGVNAVQLWSSADAPMIFATNNAEKLRIDSSGRIGVGVSPTAQYAHNLIQIGHQATLGANAALSATGQTFLTHNLYFDTGGTLKVFNTSNANEGAIFRLVDGQLLFSNSAATTGTPTVTERLRIDSSGRLIQRYSAAPYNNRAATFQAPAGQTSTYIAVINTETNGASGILFGDHAGQNAGNFDGYINYSHQYQHMQFLVGSGTERLRIASNGTVSVKTGGINLENATATSSRAYSITNAAGTTGWTFGNGVTASSHQFVIYDNTAGAARLTIDSDGKIGHNKAASGCTFDVEPVNNTHAMRANGQQAGYATLICDNRASSGTRHYISFRISNGVTGKITSTGSSTVYATSSDYRLKENVTAISDGITRLKTLKPSRFNWKADSSTTVAVSYTHLTLPTKA